VSAHVTQWLSAYLDGEVAPDERLRLEEHLRECGECGGRLEQLAAVDAAARELQVEPPAGYLDSFSGRVRQRIEASRRPLRVPGWAIALAAGLVIAVATPLMVFRERSAAPAPAGPAALDQPAGTQTEPVPMATTAPEPPRPQAKALAEGYAAAPAVPAPDKHALARAPIVIDGGERLSGQNAQEAAGAKVEEAPPPPPTLLRDADRQAEAKRTDRALESEESRPSAAKPVTPPGPPESAAGIAGRLEKDERTQKSQAAPGADDARAGFRRVPAATPGRGDAVNAPATFEELRRSVMTTLDEARLAWERCRAFVRDHPSDPQREEARVLCIQMGGMVYGLSRDANDRETTLAAARAYLAESDTRQKARVQSVVDGLKR
jgi:anti-sigma factor RsiW